MFMVLTSSMDIASDARPFQSEDPLPPGVGTFGPFSSGTLLPANWLISRSWSIATAGHGQRQGTLPTEDLWPYPIPGGQRSLAVTND